MSRLVSLSLSLGNVMEEIVPERPDEARKDTKVMGSCCHGFPKGRSCFTDLCVFHVEVTRFVDKDRAVAGINCDFAVKTLCFLPLHAPRETKKVQVV